MGGEEATEEGADAGGEEGGGGGDGAGQAEQGEEEERGARHGCTLFLCFVMLDTDTAARRGNKGGDADRLLLASERRAGL